MSNIQLSKKNTLFREVILEKIINRSFKFLLYRSILRYGVRFFGFKKSKFIYHILNNVTSNNENKFLLETNILHLESINAAIINDWQRYITSKKKLIHHVLNKSNNQGEIEAANFYSKIFEKKPLFDEFNNINKNKSKILIYGPNSTAQPINNKGYDILVLSKMPNFEINDFDNVYIYLNNNIAKKVEKKDFQFIKSNLSLFIDNTKLNWEDSNIYKTTHSPRSVLYSPMGLQRILYDLTFKHSNSFINIQGFDMYTKSIGYSGNIKTLYPLKNIELTEKVMCISVLSHDPVFNFLFTKEVIKNFIFMDDSIEFKKLIENDLIKYLTLLSSTRKFNILNKLF